MLVNDNREAQRFFLVLDLDLNVDFHNFNLGSAVGRVVVAAFIFFRAVDALHVTVLLAIAPTPLRRRRRLVLYQNGL